MIEKPTLVADLEKLLNSHSAENASGTPDFILAEYMMHCLRSFNAAVCAREAWHGRDAYGLTALRALKDDAALRSHGKFVGSHDVQDGE